MNKFAVIPVSRRKIHELVIERRKVEYKDKARTLGFKFRRTGYPRGIEDQARRASMQVTKLKRFRAENAKTSVHLYKQLVLPIIFKLMYYLKVDMRRCREYKYRIER